MAHTVSAGDVQTSDRIRIDQDGMDAWVNVNNVVRRGAEVDIYADSPFASGESVVATYDLDEQVEVAGSAAAE
ncbi:hypothetical protein SEA_ONEDIRECTION_27 [Gordonia phage OneDirection]|nr:hypothetical protein SEA_ONEDIRECTION_27 [Gordonia phage OneDirection]